MVPLESELLLAFFPYAWQRGLVTPERSVEYRERWNIWAVMGTPRRHWRRSDRESYTPASGDYPETRATHEHRMKHELRARWQVIAIVVACIVGIALRVMHLSRRGNLWLDEAMLAQSIVDRSPRGLLFSPLDFHQVAPPGFLQALKLSTLLVSPIEIALRLPAMLYSIAGLILFAFIAARRLPKLEPLVAVVVLAAGPLVIAYAAEAKQYSSDMFFTLLISYVALELRDSGYSSRWLRIAAALGLIVVWFSDTAVITLAGVGIALALTALFGRDRKAVRPLLILGVVWSAAAIAALIGAERRVAGGTASVMRSYWTGRGSFMPIPRSANDALWLPRTLADVLINSLGLRILFGLTILLALWGIISLWRRGDRHLLAIFFAPVVLTLIAALARLYPFAGRLTLFLVPAFAIAVAAGIGSIGGLARRWAPVAQIVILLMLLSPQRVLTAAHPLPWRVQEIDPVLAYIAANRQPGDKMYAYWGAYPAAMFYGRRYGFNYENVTAGTVSKEWKVVAEDAAQLRGSSRVWVLFSHDLEPGLRHNVLHHLDSIGSRYPAVGDSAEGVRAYLYDLR